MSVATLSHIAQVLSALAAFAAAGCWWRAATAFVPAPHREDGAVGLTMDGAITFLAGKERARLFETLQLQSRWNARGAFAAGIAAALQGLALLA